MFCDLVGSTALSEELDPEDLRGVIRGYQQVCDAEIVRAGGFTAEYLGDGLLAYFGYPRAHEDDPRRAVRAGLAVIDAVRGLAAAPTAASAAKLSVRVGVHTGLVVVGEMGVGDRVSETGVGETPNVAARLQALADANTLVISEATRALCAGYFTLQALGLQRLKGLKRPLAAHRVLGETRAKDRLDVTDTEALTPLVEREQEISLLLDRWQRVKQGTGQLVQISGEAGVGKSRLVHVLRLQTAREPSLQLELRCSSHHETSAFRPVIDLLHRSLGIHPDDTAELRIDKIEKELARTASALEATVPLFASLLSVPLPERYPPILVSSERQKQQTLEACLAWLLESAKSQPVLLVVEDLHWVDPSTLELLRMIVEQGPTHPILTVITFRPEFMPPWYGRTDVTSISLNRLTQDSVATMVQAVAGARVLPQAVTDEIVRRTDGIPLFVEEFTRMVLDSALLEVGTHEYRLTAALRTLAIPVTLHDSLTARLDRLGGAKDVAQLAAVIGREFSYALLREVSDLPEDTLREGLTRLVSANLVYCRGVAPHERFYFKHALIRDAAYQASLRSRRAELHGRIADVLARSFPEAAETQPELLAHHYSEAKQVGPAIEYWLRAARRATELSAYVEAIHQLHTALDFLHREDASPERPQRELSLMLVLGASLMATYGFSHPEVREAYARAVALVREAGESRQHFPAVRGSFTFYIARAEHGTARELAEQMREIAAEVGHSTLTLGARIALGQSMFFTGELEGARRHLEGAIELYDPERHRARGARAGQDPGATALCYAPLALAILGDFERSRELDQRLIELNRGLDHPFTWSFSRAHAAWGRLLRREPSSALEASRETIDHSARHGFAYIHALGHVFEGWSWVQLGDAARALPSLEAGIGACRATGARLGFTFMLSVLAEACAATGHHARAAALLAEATELVQSTGERFHESELSRLHAELASTRDHPDAAHVESHLRRALEVASAQQALTFELRAATTWHRLARGRPDAAAARARLEDSLSRFPAETAAPDVAEAREHLRGGVVRRSAG